MAQVTLSSFLAGLSGTTGKTVFVNRRDGLIMRTRTTPKNPQTTKQTQARGALSRASILYRAMTPAQAQTWRDYAETRNAARTDGDGTRRLSGITAFTGLTSKFLQMHPAGDVPMTPPNKAFGGDTPTLTATGAAGHVLFTASGPNAQSVVTEVLLQPLLSQNRTPTRRDYRTQGFSQFTESGLTAAVTTAPGWYAPAYRFVRSDTGQSSPLVTLAPVRVE